MILQSNRAELDAALNDPKNIFLLLFGRQNEKANKIHDIALKASLESWCKVVLITERSVLTVEEVSGWYRDDSYYTTLSRLNQGSGRVVVEQHPLDELLSSGGAPSVRQLHNAFANAEFDNSPSWKPTIDPPSPWPYPGKK